LWGWTVDNFQLSETVLKGRTGGGGSQSVGQLRKLRVSRPQASLCAGACVCARAHHSCGSGLPALRVPAPDRRSLRAGRARSSSTLGFTTWRAVPRLTQVLRGRWAKRGELLGAVCAGQGRASRAWGVRQKGLRRTPPLYGSLCMAADSFACEPTTPGTQVSVRAQKGLCPGQLAQLPCDRTARRHS
jgi:hypothetical protein